MSADLERVEPPTSAQRRRSGVKISKRAQARFLEALELGHSVTHAAKLAGFNRDSAYRLRGKEPEFAEAWDVAVESGTDKLEDELVKAATEGWEEIDVVEEHGNVVRRVSRRRRDPRLLAKVREWRRPPTLHVSGQVHHVHEGGRVSTLGDLLALARELGREDVLRLPVGGEDAEIVEAEAVEVEAVDADDPPADGLALGVPFHEDRGGAGRVDSAVDPLRSRPGIRAKAWLRESSEPVAREVRPDLRELGS
jgi:hypothetical protein